MNIYNLTSATYVPPTDFNYRHNFFVQSIYFSPDKYRMNPLCGAFGEADWFGSGLMGVLVVSVFRLLSFCIS